MWSSESSFTREFCTRLKKVNCVVSAFVASRMQEPGIPDRRVWGLGLPGVWCEFKFKRGRLRLDQKLWMDKRNAWGDPCLVVRWDGVITLETTEHHVLIEEPMGDGVFLRGLLVRGVQVLRAQGHCTAI